MDRRVPRAPYIAVLGDESLLEREESATRVLRGLGARVHSCALWGAAAALVAREGSPRAVVVELLERPDLAAGVIRELRELAPIEGVGIVVAVSAPQVAQLDPAAGFDDFALVPYLPAELYARIRNVEWRRGEFSNEERVKLGRIVIDRHGHQVSLAGREVQLTSREFALLVYLCERRGRVVRRSEALGRVWGDSYEGGERTVDIHVRRLRSKFGAELPLQTIRGVGYKVSEPGAEP
jgi:DNA-binding response OmpR family regulator